MRSLSRSQMRGNVLPPKLMEGARGRMLKTSLQLFARQGFHGTSVRDITNALEIQPSALYAHFESKEDLLAQLLCGGYEFHHETLRGAALGAGADPVKQLQALVRSNATFHATYPVLAIVLHEESHVLDFSRTEGARVLREQSLALLSDVITRAVAQERCKTVDVATTLAAIGAMAIRIPYWFSAASALTVADLGDAQAQLALRMLGISNTR